MTTLEGLQKTKRVVIIIRDVLVTAGSYIPLILTLLQGLGTIFPTIAVVTIFLSKLSSNNIEAVKKCLDGLVTLLDLMINAETVITGTGLGAQKLAQVLGALPADVKVEVPEISAIITKLKN